MLNVSVHSRKNRDIFEPGYFYSPRPHEELVAVPNVTAIDWKQADALALGNTAKAA